MSPALAHFFRGEPVLVTGASGFIGWHVADQLSRLGAKVRVLVRPASAPRLQPPPGAAWEIARGDLLDPASLAPAVAGCRYLFHVAGDYRLWARHPEEILRPNRDGTAHLLDAARAAGLERTVVTGSPGILRRDPAGGAADESALADPAHLEGPYKRAKFAANLETEIRAGQWIVTALPTAPIGWRDVKPTPTGAIVEQFLRGRIPLLARTGLNFVDVRGTARGHLLAMIHGRPGERYLLGGENLWLREFFERLAPLAPGVRVPERYAPVALSYAAACVAEWWAWVGVTGHTPFVTREGVRMSRYPHFFTSAKAERELGYTVEPIDAALREAVAYFRQR